MDHAQLVHKQWTHVAEQGLNLYIVRVGTHDNIADLPSREVRCMRKAAAVLVHVEHVCRILDSWRQQALSRCRPSCAMSAGTVKLGRSYKKDGNCKSRPVPASKTCCVLLTFSSPYVHEHQPLPGSDLCVWMGTVAFCV